MIYVKSRNDRGTIKILLWKHILDFVEGFGDMCFFFSILFLMLFGGFCWQCLGTCWMMFGDIFEHILAKIAIDEQARL